jgi:hypothetical protein
METPEVLFSDAEKQDILAVNYELKIILIQLHQNHVDLTM